MTCANVPQFLIYTYLEKKHLKKSVVLKKCVSLRHPRGEILGCKDAFLALSRIVNSPKFQEGMESMQRSFCVYIVGTAHAVRCCYIYHSVGCLFLCSFSYGVWRYLLCDEQDRSHAFLVSVRYESP